MFRAFIFEEMRMERVSKESSKGVFPPPQNPPSLNSVLNR